MQQALMLMVEKKKIEIDNEKRLYDLKMSIQRAFRKKLYAIGE